MNTAIATALSIMGMGMSGIFTAILIIMAVTYGLNKFDALADVSAKRHEKNEPQESTS